MPDINLESLNHIGALGVLSLFILCNTIIAVFFMRLVKDNVIPMLTNHLTHVEQAFDRMNHTLMRNTDILEMIQEDIEAERKKRRDT